MSDRYARMFAGYSVGVKRAPDEVRHEVKRRILDTFGVMYAASREPTIARFKAYGELFPTAAGATLFGTKERTAPEAAALINGVMARYLDFNDTYLSKEPLHPSDMIPALLALAEWRGKSGAELLDAVAVAYEIGVTLCDSASLRAHGWDHVNFIAVGAACGAARLLGLSQDQAEHAVSIATMPHAATRQTRAGELSNWKGAAAANACRNAVFGTALASLGVTGPYRPFEGEMGFVAQLLDGEPFDDAVFAAIEAERPPRRILDTYIKAYPVEYHAQSVVDIVRELAPQLAGPEAVEHITIETFKAAYEIIAKDPEKWRPQTRETADHSIQYITAVGLLDGEVTQGSFAEEKLQDATVRRWLAECVTLEEKDELTAGYPDGIPNRVKVTTTDGRTLHKEVKYPRGHAKNPMTDDEVLAKFYRNADGIIGRERAEALADVVMGLDGEDDVAKVVAAW